MNKIWILGLVVAGVVFGLQTAEPLPSTTTPQLASKPIYTTQYVYLNVTNWVYPKATNWLNVTNYFTQPIDLLTISNLYISKVVTN